MSPQLGKDPKGYIRQGRGILSRMKGAKIKSRDKENTCKTIKNQHKWWRKILIYKKIENTQSNIKQI